MNMHVFHLAVIVELRMKRALVFLAVRTMTRHVCLLEGSRAVDRDASIHGQFAVNR